MPPMTKRDGAQLPHISVWYCNPVNLNLSGSTLLEKHTSRPDSPVKPLQALLSLRAGQPLRLPRSQRSQRRELLVRRLLARPSWSGRPCCRLHPYPTQSSLAASPARAHVRTSPRCLPPPSCSA